ncbi:cytochrome C oxidase subunit IV family protein [Mycoplana sp. MJR14]|uniref:cytochrome C oxidase subunit IV family protein n=1 Tax=Mycoplana sp. MJR14 TaxID=3032583 RepID=UPI000DDB407A|nr:cytochrome C oxidase subunit IV family protein [Mycoplana sp. MJR14]MDF1634313.1 cytochrome C oxidase subunit IV family protein [Mycoplana sp. MJR14]
MNPKTSGSLFASTNWILMMGVVSGIVSAQWKHEALPIVALAAILLLTVFKARLIILDFMHLRERPALAAALLGWPILFCIAVLAKIAVPALL